MHSQPRTKTFLILGWILKGDKGLTFFFSTKIRKNILLDCSAESFFNKRKKVFSSREITNKNKNKRLNLRLKSIIGIPVGPRAYCPSGPQASSRPTRKEEEWAADGGEQRVWGYSELGGCGPAPSSDTPSAPLLPFFSLTPDVKKYIYAGSCSLQNNTAAKSQSLNNYRTPPLYLLPTMNAQEKQWFCPK